jgi:hypothetical protein
VAINVVVDFSAVVGYAIVVDEWISRADSDFLVVVVAFFFRRVTTSSIRRSVCLVCTVVGALVYVLMMLFLFMGQAGLSAPPFLNIHAEIIVFLEIKRLSK